jgi:hypothetical protein
VLLELLAWQEKQIDALKQEILKLKGETTKPKIKPSKMDEDASDGSDNGGSDSSKPKKGPKRSKTEHLKLMPRSLSNRTRFQRAQPLRVIGK